jgi:hypothetical protein
MLAYCPTCSNMLLGEPSSIHSAAFLELYTHASVMPLVLVHCSVAGPDCSAAAATVLLLLLLCS